MGKTYLKDIAYEQIKEKIFMGFYKERNISENDLVKELNMSRTPIREALQRLEYEGLLKIYSNRGIFLQNPSIKEVNDMFDMRIAIETFSLRKVIKVITSQQVKDLENLLTEQQKALEERDMFKFFKGDSEFHSFLLKISDNEFMGPIFENISDRLFHHGSFIFEKSLELSQNSWKEHVQILEAIKDKDLATAIKHMEAHLENGKKNELVNSYSTESL
jgi:DNA-binding GntR family transcriptional regulator